MSCFDNMPSNYFFRKTQGMLFQGKSETVQIDSEIFQRALFLTNANVQILKENAEGLFATLGMRNLSAFVGEMFAAALVKSSNGLLLKNPHQDGYPDLLVMTKEGRALLDTLQNNLQDKAPFSGFATGGIEVKATCGSVPTPKQLGKTGFKKPDIGDTRINFLRGYDWKAHHRQTNNLLGIVWDFIDGAPIIVAIFYSPVLGIEDWGKIVQPKEGGGRTTSVSIMTRDGIKKMYDGWIAVISDEHYRNFFDKFNSDRRFKQEALNDTAQVVSMPV